MPTAGAAEVPEPPPAAELLDGCDDGFTVVERGRRLGKPRSKRGKQAKLERRDPESSRCDSENSQAAEPRLGAPALELESRFSEQSAPIERMVSVVETHVQPSRELLAHELMPLPASASERTVRTRALLCSSFASADMRAECPSGHRLAVAATSGARKRLCMNCRGRISAVFVTCAVGHFAACIRCTLAITDAAD